MNFPGGDVSKLSQDKIDLVKEIFSIIISDESLENLVGIKNLQHTSLLYEDYIKRVIPTLSKKLASYNGLRINDEFHESFKNFIIGEIGEGDDFLKYIVQLHNSELTDNKKTGDLICLAKHILMDVLFKCFQKSLNRNFGRSRGQENKNGKIVPFNGVDAPSTTKFGYPYEALCFHFMAVLQDGVEEDQILKMADEIKRLAKVSASLKGKEFNKTYEAKLFKKLTNVDLSEIKNGENLKIAKEFINKSAGNALHFEAINAMDCIEIHKNRFTSNSQDIVNLLASVKGMTGTPYNANEYGSHLNENLFLEKGSEGKILYTLIKKSESTQFHIVEEFDIDLFLDNQASKRTPEDLLRICAFMDSGGLLKGKNNKEIASSILKFLKNINSEKKGVVFFDKSLGSAISDKLVVLKHGEKNPILLQGTSEDDLKKAGLSSNDVFYLYDEIHNTGIDFKLPFNALGFITVDENMLVRNQLQTIMRERQFITGEQSVEFIVTKNVQKKIINGGNSVKDCVTSAIINQAVEKSESFLRSCKQKINYFFVEKFNEISMNIDYVKLTNEDKFKLKCAIKAFSHFYRPETIDDPFAQFFRKEREVETLKNIRDFADDAIKNFTSRCDEEFCKFFPNVINELRENLNKFIEHIASTYKHILPETIKSNQNNGVGVEVQNQVEVQQEQQNKNLQIELDEYNRERSDVKYSEDFWDDKKAEEFIDKISNLDAWDNGRLNVMKLRGFMESNETYRNNFYEIFDENIYVTSNFGNSIAVKTTVFNKLQRPASQLLVIKLMNNHVKITFLSEAEASFYKTFLQSNRDKYKNVLLLQASGDQLVYNNSALNVDVRDRIKRGLLQANIFNCNSYYLVQHENETICWIQEKNHDLKQLFLSLKAESNELNRLLLHSNGIIGNSKNKYILNNKRRFTTKEIQDLKNAEEIYKLNEYEVKYLCQGQIKYMNPQFVGALHTEEQIQAAINKDASWLNKINKNAIKFIKPEQFVNLKDVVLITNTPKEVIEMLELKHYNGKVENLHILSNSQVSWLKDPDLIERLRDGQLSYVDDVIINNIVNNNPETFKTLIDKEPNLINKLSEVSIASINDVELIKKLNINQLSHVNDKVINNIFENNSETFKALIDKEQNLINKLFNKNFLSLLYQNDDNLKATTKQRMQNVVFVRQLLQEIDNNDNIINQFIIPNLDANTISTLYNENRLYVNNIQHCNQGQCKDFSNIKLVRNLKNEQLRDISNESVKAISLRKVHHLLPRQIAHATKLQKLAFYVTTIALGVLSILVAILLFPTHLFYKKFWKHNFSGVNSKHYRMWLLFANLFTTNIP